MKPLFIFVAVLLLWLFACPATLAIDRTGFIAGGYIESRSNHVFGCYCEWSSDSVTAGREAIIAWDIQRSNVPGVDLTGKRAAAVLVAQDTLSMGTTPRKAILFVDADASPSQQKALEWLLRKEFAALLGEVISVHPARIEFSRKAQQARVKVGDYVEVKMRAAKLPQDALQGAILWFDPFIPLEESTLATTLQYKYAGKDFGQQWNKLEPTVSGYYGSFHLDTR
jgi:hypothetical protein